MVSFYFSFCFFFCCFAVDVDALSDTGEVFYFLCVDVCFFTVLYGDNFREQNGGREFVIDCSVNPFVVYYCYGGNACHPCGNW